MGAKRIFRSLLIFVKWTMIVFGLIAVTVTGFMLGWKSWSPGNARMKASAQRTVQSSILANASRAPSTSSSRITEFLEDAASLTRFGGHLSLGSARAFQLVEELDPSELPRAFAAAAEGPATASRQKVVALLLDRWSKLNPSAALNASAQAFADNREDFLRHGRMPLIRLAKADPAAAFASWQEYHAPLDKDYDNSTEFQLSSVFSEWAKQDLNDAMTHYHTLSSDEAESALRGMLDTSDTKLRDQLLAFAEKSGDTGALAIARSKVVDRLARSGKHEEAILWMDSQELDAETRGALEEKVADGWFERDQRAATAWLLEHSDDSNRSERLADIASDWADWEANAAGAWLSEMVEQHGPQTDKAIRTFATSIARKDPATALDWVATISNSQERQKAAKYVGRQFAMRLMEGIEPILAESSLNQAERSIVLEESRKTF